MSYEYIQYRVTGDNETWDSIGAHHHILGWVIKAENTPPLRRGVTHFSNGHVPAHQVLLIPRVPVGTTWYQIKHPDGTYTPVPVYPVTDPVTTQTNKILPAESDIVPFVRRYHTPLGQDATYGFEYSLIDQLLPLLKYSEAYQSLFTDRNPRAVHYLHDENDAPARRLSDKEIKEAFYQAILSGELDLATLAEIADEVAMDAEISINETDSVFSGSNRKFHAYISFQEGQYWWIEAGTLKRIAPATDDDVKRSIDVKDYGRGYFVVVDSNGNLIKTIVNDENSAKEREQRRKDLEAAKKLSQKAGDIIEAYSLEELQKEASQWDLAGEQRLLSLLNIEIQQMPVSDVLGLPAQNVRSTFQSFYDEALGDFKARHEIVQYLPVWGNELKQQIQDNTYPFWANAANWGALALGVVSIATGTVWVAGAAALLGGIGAAADSYHYQTPIPILIEMFGGKILNTLTKWLHLGLKTSIKLAPTADRLTRRIWRRVRVATSTAGQTMGEWFDDALGRVPLILVPEGGAFRLRLISSGSSGGKIPSPPAGGPGQWVIVKRGMTKAARDYQTRITEWDGWEYEVNGVLFDGFDGVNLIDAKGNYSQFLDDQGKWHGWWTGGDNLVREAERQLEAAGKTPIIWYVQDQKGANAISVLLKNRVSGTIIVLVR
jgi:hypothetical protein